MNAISVLADKMISSQSFDYESFDEAKAIAEVKEQNKSLFIEYDRLSLCVYAHNLSNVQYWRTGQYLNKWLKTHDNDNQKLRIEYGIFFHYALLRPEFLNAQIKKNLHPDFIARLNGKTIGIEVTRLEKECDNLATKILHDIYKPGMKPNEVLELAFKKHGFKAKKYQILECGNVLGIQHIDDMLITRDAFVSMITRKIDKYETRADQFDTLIILCSAQHGITITSEEDASNLIRETIENRPSTKLKFAVLYCSQSSMACFEK
jgi:hypothetical protein